MGCTPESEDADAVMLRKPAQASADPLSALFQPLTDAETAEYAECLGPAAEKERTWGVRAGIRNLNEQGSNPLRPEDVPPKSAAEICLWFRF